jgi:hypothetical protein
MLSTAVRSTLVPFALAMTVVNAPAVAQDAPLLDTKTAFQVALGVSDSALNSIVADGFRIIDIDRVGTNLYDAVFVKNEGVYFNSQAAWYPSLSESALASLFTNSTKQLIDLQRYTVGTSVNYLAVVAGSEGAEQVDSWDYELSLDLPGNVDYWFNWGLFQPVSVQSYSVGTETDFLAIGKRPGDGGWLVSDTAYEWSLTKGLNEGLEATDIEFTRMRDANTPEFNFVYRRDKSATRVSSWVKTVAPSLLLQTLAEYGERPIDLERWVDGNGNTQLTGIFVCNMNAIEKRLSNAAPDLFPASGSSGFFVKQVGGPLIAERNADIRQDMAGALRVVHGVRMVQRCAALPFDSLDLDTLLYNEDTQNPSECPNGVPAGAAFESVRTVLTRMMTLGDNNAADLIATECGGLSALTSWMDGLGLGDANLFVNIGCGSVFVNSGTPRAIAGLYEKAANGSLFSSGWEEELWNAMSGGTGTSSLFATIINEEASEFALSLTPTEVAEFKASFKYHRQTGSVGTASTSFVASSGGIVRIPFKTGFQTVVVRDFVGASVRRNLSSSSDASASIADWAELFREQIRAGLASWADACTPPSITTQPSLRLAYPGQSSGFTVVAESVGTATYLWKRDGISISNGAIYSGVTTPNLSIAAASAAVAGNYTCTITNACGATTTVPAALVVIEPPCLGDLNLDGVVDAVDLSRLLITWGTASPAEDLNRDGIVNAADLSQLLIAWGACD